MQSFNLNTAIESFFSPKILYNKNATLIYCCEHFFNGSKVSWNLGQRKVILTVLFIYFKKKV